MKQLNFLALASQSNDEDNEFAAELAAWTLKHLMDELAARRDVPMDLTVSATERKILLGACGLITAFLARPLRFTLATRGWVRLDLSAS